MCSIMTLITDRKQRRCDHDIIANILIISKEGATKTQILYGANLSYALLNKYLEFLTKTGLLEYKIIKKGKYLFFLTKKGSDYLSYYKGMQLCASK